MVTFVTDSGYDFPNIRLPFDFKLLPLRVYIGEREFLDKVTIQATDVYKVQREGGFPTTSLPSPENIERTLREASLSSDEVYILTISSKLSNTYSVIKSMVSELNLSNVKVLDTKSACIKQGYVVWRAMKHYEKYGSLSQEDVDNFNREVILLFLVPTLDYLYKGGRIGKAKALIGKLLSIKPILTVDEEGEVSSVATCRSIDAGVKVMYEIAQRFLKERSIQDNFIAVGAYTVPSMKPPIDKLAKFFGSKFVGSTTIGSAIAAHVGPEAFAIVIGRGE